MANKNRRHPQTVLKSPAAIKGSGQSGVAAKAARAERLESFTHRIWPYGFLLLLAIVFHGRLVFAAPGSIIATDDIGFYFYWLHEYSRDQLLSGHWPLWNPFNYGGMPFAANPQATVFYPLTWVYLVMGVADSHRVLIVIHGFMAGSFMYLFLRRLRLGTVASLIGALPYMLGLYFMANVAVGHLTVLYSMAWLPLAMYCLERAFQGPRAVWLFWTGMVLGIQALAGEPQSSLYTAILVVGYACFRETQCIEVDGRRRWFARFGSWALAVAVIGAVAALAGAVQLLPTAEFAWLSDRSARTIEFATTMSLPPSGLSEFLLPWPDERLQSLALFDNRFVVPKDHEYAGYVGIMTMALIGASMFVRRNPALWAARIMAIVALILMLGNYTPVYHWLSMVFPPMSWFRIPARAGLILAWCISVMAAFGASGIFDSAWPAWRDRAWRWSGAAVCLAALVIIVAAVGLAPATKTIKVSGHPAAQDVRLILTDPLLVRTLAMLSATAVILIAMRWMTRTLAATIATVLIAVDLFSARPSYRLIPYDVRQHPNLALMGQFRETVGDADLFRIDLPQALMDPNAALHGGVENINAYTPMALRRPFRFFHWMRHAEPSPHFRHQLPDELYQSGEPFALRLLNVLFGATWNGAQGQYELLQNPSPLPRAWLVDHVEVIEDDQAALLRLRDPAFLPEHSVILSNKPEREMSTSDLPLGSCRATRRSPQELHIDIHAQRDCWLVISEMHYPGWKALDNGRPVQMERADYLINAIPLSAGKHTVDYRYDPLSVKIGAAMTGLMGLIAAVVLVRQWRGRAKAINA